MCGVHAASRNERERERPWTSTRRERKREEDRWEEAAEEKRIREDDLLTYIYISLIAT